MLATPTVLRPAATATIGARVRWLTLAAPAAVYLAVRAAGVGLFAWMPDRWRRPFSLAPWDGHWYLALAEHGYRGVPYDLYDAHGRHGPFTSMAFFPGYPWLVRAVATLIGGHYLVAAVTVSTVAGVVAAYGVARLARHVTGSQRAGLITVVLFAAAPMSIVYSLAYAEALFCALAAWALVGVVERRWLLAGLFTAAAGLVSPSVVVVVAVVVAVALWEVARRRDWRAAVAAAVAPSGLALYLGWVAVRTGSLAGYPEIQSDGWRLTFDGGIKTAQWTVRTLTGQSPALETTTVFETVTVGVMLAALVLLVISARRMPWPLWAYGCLVVVLVVGTSGTMFMKMRELLPAFVLLIPIAATLARQRHTVAVSLTVGYVAVGLWIGAYSLTVWPFAI